MRAPHQPEPLRPSTSPRRARPPATPLAGPPPGAPAPAPVPRRSADRLRRPGRGAGRILPFRRRRGLPVRRRSRLASFARPFLAALAIVGVPAAALWWSATSPRFALAELEVYGSERVSGDWVRGELADLAGRNLVWMPLDRVERLLAAHPWVAGAEVTKELPDRLRVVVVERRPAAVLEMATAAGPARFWVDRGGALIEALTDEEGAAQEQRAPRSGRPLLELVWEGDDPGGAAGEADRRTDVLAAALGVERELGAAAPRWRRGLERIRILGPEELRLEGEELPFPVVVRAVAGGAAEGGASVAAQIHRLERVLPRILSGDLPERLPVAVRTPSGELEPALVDLRFADRIVIRPAAERAPGADTEAEEEKKERGA